MAANLSNRLARMIGLAAAPVFLALSAANLIASYGSGTMAPEHAQDSLIGASLSGALPSMWLMYALMALAHLPAWLDGRHKNGGGKVEVGD